MAIRVFCFVLLSCFAGFSLLSVIQDRHNMALRTENGELNDRISRMDKAFSSIQADSADLAMKVVKVAESANAVSAADRQLRQQYDRLQQDYTALAKTCAQVPLPQ